MNTPGYDTAAGVMRWAANDDDAFYGGQPPHGSCRFLHASNEQWRVEDDMGLLHVQNETVAFVRDAHGVMVRVVEQSPDVPDGHPWSLFGNPLMRGDLFTTETDFYYPTGPARSVRVAGRRGWEVELKPPAHKPYPLLVTVDDLTGTVLRQIVGDDALVFELTEFTPHVEIDPFLFEWAGPYAEPPPPPAGHRGPIVDPGTELTPALLDALRERLSIMEVLVLALDRRRELTDAIAAADDALTARAAVADLMGISTDSAHWIIDMQLRRFARSEAEKIRQEHAELRSILARAPTDDA